MYYKSSFTGKKLEKRGLNDDEIDFAMENCNYLMIITKELIEHEFFQRVIGNNKNASIG